MNEAFSSARREYTATVDASYTAHVLITPTLSPGTAARLTIDGAEVPPGTPHQVPLRLGANTFAIALEPRQGGPATTYRLTITQKDLSKEYRSEPLGKGVWRIQDFGGFVSNGDMYLIEGQDRALLFDTGMGRGDLAAFVKSADAPAGRRRHQPRQPRPLPAGRPVPRRHGLHVGEGRHATSAALVTSRYKWIKDGDVIDIGAGRRFEVVEVPGHSLGSVLYIDFAEQDGGHGRCDQFGQHGLRVRAHVHRPGPVPRGLKRLEARVSALDGLTLLVGHHYQEKTPLRGQAGKQLISGHETRFDIAVTAADDSVRTYTVVVTR